MEEIRVLSSRAEKTLAATVLALGALGVSSLTLLDPTKVAFFPKCPLLALTGFACPGCGITRAFHAFFHGDVLGALDYNLLFPIWLFVFVYFAGSLISTLFRGRGLPLQWITPAFLFSTVGFMLLFGIVRNIPVYPFTILFP
ncbi:MAG: DUF2752 domain-containing protein [Pyrinomonadaceae bacterium]